VRMNGTDKGSVARIFSVVSRPGLTRTLIMWFLIMALAPLTVVSTISYLQAKEHLINSIVEAQQTAIALKTAFIDNWFFYRHLDLETQSSNLGNTRFLKELRRAFQTSGKEIGDFVGSYRWASIVDKHSANLKTFRRTHGYYDIFIIDSYGNVLFTAIGETDLGTNLFNGLFSDTLFARACRQSLESGRQIFSDFEFYAPSNNTVAGFLAAPIVAGNGDKIGIFAFQVPIDKIDTIMQNRTGLGQTGETYLVGADLTLRSNSGLHEEDKILDTRVDTEQTRKWYQEHIAGHTGIERKVALIYRGHRGRNVLGIHMPLDIAGIKWGLIAEIEETEAFTPVARLKRIVLILGIGTGIMVLAAALVLSWRIVSPLWALTTVAEQVQAGEKDVRAVVSSGNEIEILAKTFNAMLDSLNRALTDAEQARDKIDGIVKSVADGLIVTDINNSIILMNHAAEELLGIRYKDVFNRPIDFAIKEKTLRKKVRETIDKKTTGYHFDFELQSEEP